MKAKLIKPQGNILRIIGTICIAYGMFELIHWRMPVGIVLIILGIVDWIIWRKINYVEVPEWAKKAMGDK